MGAALFSAFQFDLEGCEQLLTAGCWLHAGLQHPHSAGQLFLKLMKFRLQAQIGPLRDQAPMNAAVAR